MTAKDQFENFQLLFFFRDTRDGMHQTLQTLRSTIASFGEIDERECTPDSIIFTSSLDLTEIIKKVLFLLQNDIMIIVQRQGPEDRAYVHPKNLEEKLLIPSVVDFRTFPLQVRAKLESLGHKLI